MLPRSSRTERFTCSSRFCRAGEKGLRSDPSRARTAALDCFVALSSVPGYGVGNPKYVEGALRIFVGRVVRPASDADPDLYFFIRGRRNIFTGPSKPDSTSGESDL
jgi:hypothetical protein